MGVPRVTEQEGGPSNDAEFMGQQHIGDWSEDMEATTHKDIEALTNWWRELAAIEADKVVPKAVEYGSTDLIEIGRTLAFTQHRHNLTEAEQAELGIYFYIVGKIARWSDAVREGRAVSDDTLHDIGVYVRMAQRVRQVGGWPFARDEPVVD